jgi:hypothetical protein
MVCALILSGCSTMPPGGSVSFVLNQQASDSAHPVPGKSYDLVNATLRLEGKGGARRLIVSAGPPSGPGRLTIEASIADSDTLEKLPGRSLPVSGGVVQVADSPLLFGGGSLTLQAVNGKLGRGNFNANVKDQQPPWEAIGNFEAFSVEPR